MDAACINYKDTGFFSHTVTDYIDDSPALRLFYGHRPDFDGFAALLKDKKVIADREILASVLKKQYSFKSGAPEICNLLCMDAVFENITLLKDANTYTVTTGHQLNIFAGPL